MINVGIVGVGFMGMTHYNAYQQVRGAKVTALCEKDKKRLAGDWRSIKGNFGPRGTIVDLSGIDRYPEIDQILADPKVDLIDICLPPAWHAEVTIAALKAGKHVFCEKPIALKTPDAARMVRTAEQAGKLLMIGHVLPFIPEYKFACQAVQSGKYGRLLGGHFKRIISDPTVTWLPDFFDTEKVGGPTVDLHVHDAHFIRVLCGMPKAVQTVARLRDDVLELFSSQFHFDAPLVVTAASGVIAQQGREFVHAFEIYLEKATILFDSGGINKDGSPATPLTLLDERGRVVRPKIKAEDPFVAEIKEVVTAVRSNTPSTLLSGDLARDALVLCQKQTQSAQRGRPVKV